MPAETVSLGFRLNGRPDVAATPLELSLDPDSHWRGSGSALSIEGRWLVTALVQTATDAVEVPLELATRDTGPPEAPTSGAGRSCGPGRPDPSYRVTIGSDPNPARAQETTFHLSVHQDGKAVTGAKVCVAADMPGMQHPGVNTVATEASAGTYDVQVKFSMVGDWEGSVTIAEPGKPAVSVPVNFGVE